jgi:hypothetical protein
MRNRRRRLAIVAATFLGVILLCVIGSVFVWRTVREFFYPLPAKMPAVVTDDIGSALRRLESALVKYAPEVIKALQPGLPDDAITAIEGKYEIHLTDELNQWKTTRIGFFRRSPTS